MSNTLAMDLVGQWQGFCTDHGEVCDLAAANPIFRVLLDASPLTDLARLAALVDFYLLERGEDALDVALGNGVFIRLLIMPAAADAILTWRGSPETTLAWVDLAGDDLTKVVSSELYQVIDPVALDELSLAALLAIGDNALIHKLVLLTQADLHTLLQLPTADLQKMAATATVEDLAWMAHHLAGLPTDEAAAVSGEVARGDVTIAALQAPVVAAPVVPEARVFPVAVVAPPPASIAPTRFAPWHSGLVIAAGFAVALLIVAAVVLARRRELDGAQDDEHR